MKQNNKFAIISSSIRYNEIKRFNMNKSKVMEIISDETLTYSQQVLALARLAESEDTTLKRNPLWIKALQEGKVCDLNEGLAPYRPRYILPDYDLLLKKVANF